MLLTRIRRCVAHDDGVTVVETMFAIMVLTIALFGLLSTLIATAHSQVSQRNRSTATRVANEQLETLRRTGFAVLKLDRSNGCLAGSSCAARQVTVGGVQYTFTPNISEVDAENLGAPRVGYPRVIKVDGVISWSDRGVARSTTYSTAIAPADAQLAQVIKSIKMMPEELVVNQLGVPSTPLNITAQLTGFNPGVPLTMSYTDDNGAKSVVLSSTDGVTWTGSIPTSGIKKVLDLNTGLGTLEFLASIPGLDGTITQGFTLPLRNTAIPVRLSDAKIAPHPIATGPIVVNASNGGGRQKDYNRDYILFEVTANGLNFDAAGNVAEIVTLTVPIQGNEQAPTGCTGSPGTWTCPIPYSTKYGTFRMWVAPNQVKFKRGTALTFTYRITRPADGDAHQVDVVRDVVSA